MRERGGIDAMRDHFRVRKGYWFAPKLFGFGVTPVTWQGWAVTFAFAGAAIATTRLVPGAAPRLTIWAALFVAFGVIAAYRTDGGLRWRWGLRGDR